MFMTGTLPRMVKMVNSPCDLLSSGTRAMPAAITLSGAGWSLLAFENDLAFVFVDAVDGARELGFAGAHQTVEADDLSRMNVEGEVVQFVSRRGV